MTKVKININNSINYVYILVKWLAIAIIVGIAGGVIGSIFHLSIDYVTELRERKPLIIMLLPVGGILIAGMYKAFQSKGRIDTNQVIEAVREEHDIPIVMLPLIFVSTVITHLFGGSAGREGAALQLGGSIGYDFGKLFRLKKSNIKTVVMSGMSAVFAALFGTPITAAIFSLEVAHVGIIRYTALFPCVVSSLVASFVAKSFGVNPVHFDGIDFGIITWSLGFKVVALAILCGVLSIIFSVFIEKSEDIMDKYVKNSYLRAFVGGAIIVLLTFSLGTYDYNGAGMNIIGQAISGTARYEAPLLKIIFTAITIAAGFKGGEIVPTFFIGSTFGCILAPFLGIPSSAAAAIGFVSMFCGMVNCPVASVFLAIEVFGAEGLGLFAVASSVSYITSGHYSLYKSQQLLYSKIDDEYPEVNTK